MAVGYWLLAFSLWLLAFCTSLNSVDRFVKHYTLFPSRNCEPEVLSLGKSRRGSITRLSYLGVAQCRRAPSFISIWLPYGRQSYMRTARVVSMYHDQSEKVRRGF